MRRTAATAAILVLASAGAFAACGIDENGLMNGDDSSAGPDVVAPNDSGGGDAGADVIVDNYVAPPCSDPDASFDASCVGAPIPVGWIPVGVQVGVADAACPNTTDFNPTTYVSSPVVTQGVTCNCTGCSPQGSWACDGTLVAGLNCGNESFDAGSAQACWTPSATHISFGGAVARVGSPTCAGGTQSGTQAATTTPVSACVPTRCQSDFCGLPQAFARCILNTTVTDGGCPTPFTNATVVGVSSTTACDSCVSCGLTNADAGCAAKLSAYNGTTPCQGTPVATAPADGTCHDTLGTDPTFTSILYSPDTPTPTCGPTTNTQTGSASLNGPLTICCKP